MKNLFNLIAAAVILAAFPSCEKQNSDFPDDFQTIETSGLKSASSLNSNLNNLEKANFRAHLNSAQEVPVNASKATGQAVFQLSKDGQSLNYKLIVANIENVTMAHIHVAPSGVNGPVVVWLYPPAPPAMLKPGKTNGILQQGAITKTDLRGRLAGLELKDLVDLINAGNTYVNVHT